MDNSPSGGSLRACATFILLVTDAPTDREPERLALQQDGLTVLTGSSLTLGLSLIHIYQEQQAAHEKGRDKQRGIGKQLSLIHI